MPRIHLVVGPTSTGKTALSIQLASRWSAPVLVLDRIQAYAELSVGGGRPSVDELGGTTRVYLVEQRVVDGELTAVEALKLLVLRLGLLGSAHDALILEGGSLSLLWELTRGDWVLGDECTVTHLTFDDEKAYRARLSARIREMLSPSSGGPSLLSELATLWRDERTHRFVRSICGYDAVLEWCRDHRISPTEVDQVGQQPENLRALHDRVLESHFAYGLKQRREQAEIVRHLESQGARLKPNPSALEAA